MKCSKGTNCEPMQLALNSRSVEDSLLINFKTGKSRVGYGVRVKKDKKKVLLFFTSCPWCLERIEP